MSFVEFFKKNIEFLKNVATDTRIPSSDKKVLLGLIALILSPIDLIPDWIPLIGLIDDVVILAIILDYFFQVLDRQILLTHYPWGMKSFALLRRLARVISALAPSWFRKYIWKYQESPYKK